MGKRHIGNIIPSGKNYEGKMQDKEKERIRDFLAVEIRKAEKKVKYSIYTEDRLRRNIRTLRMIAKELGIIITEEK